MVDLARENVLEALRKVMDPDLGRDLVSLNMVQDLEVHEGGRVSVRIVLTTPACPMKARIEADVRAAMMAVPGVRSADIKMDAQVRRQGAGAKAQPIPGVAHVVLVSSGKGGVGKSTVAVNLACALARAGAKVGLLDADVYGPNTPTMLGVTEQPEVITDPERGELFVPPLAYGVKLMSMGFLLERDQPVVWRGPMLHNVLNQFCHQVQWGELDYLIVDMPPGTGDVQLSIAQLVPVSGAVLVTTPQEVALQDVGRAFHMFEKVCVPVLGIVENMSTFTCDQCGKQHHPFGTQGGRTLAEKFHVPLLAQLPLLPPIREGGDEGAPIAAREPKSEVGQAFLALATKVAQQISMQDRRA